MGRRVYKKLVAEATYIHTRSVTWDESAQTRHMHNTFKEWHGKEPKTRARHNTIPIDGLGWASILQHVAWAQKKHGQSTTEIGVNIRNT